LSGLRNVLGKAIKELYRAKQIGVLPDCLRNEYEKEQQQQLQAAMSSSAAER
jgi:hypothetical protein